MKIRPWIMEYKLRLGLITSVVAAAILIAIPSYAQSASSSNLKYVALGDSVAAGAGLPLASNSTDDTICARSSQGYPYVLAAQLGTSVTDLACSGASISNGITGAQTITRDGQRYTVPSQLDRAFENGVPDLITMTIGANDLSFSLRGQNVSWQDVLQRCYTEECGGYLQSTAIGLRLTALQARLANTLREIKNRSGDQAPPKVLITEYYYPVTATTCLGGGITNDEANWVNYQAYNLNKAIRQTITASSRVSSFFKGTYNFATYVPVNFNGHGLCSSDPWIQGLSDPAPIHPTATGQTVYAAALAQYGR